MNFYAFAKAVLVGFFRFAFRVRIEGAENIPKGRAFVICSNHISNLDPPLLGAFFPIPLRFMAKEELFRNKLIGGLMGALGGFPVKRGTSDIGALRSAVRMLRGGESVVIFPEGTRAKKAGQLLPGKPGAVLIALKSDVDILPVGISGRYRLFGKVTVRIGKVIPVDKYADKKPGSAELQQITDGYLMPEIAGLAEVEPYEGGNRG